MDLYLFEKNWLNVVLKSVVSRWLSRDQLNTRQTPSGFKSRSVNTILLEAWLAADGMTRSTGVINGAVDFLKIIQNRFKFF